jgi:hypothetical protein
MDSDPDPKQEMHLVKNHLKIIKNRDAPDTVIAGYPAGRISGYSKAGYRISDKGRKPDIRPDTWLNNNIFGNISNKFIKKL